MIEAIIEELAGIVFEGMIKGSESSKLPAPLRWVLRVLVFAVFAVIIGVLVLAAIAAFREGGIAIGVVLIAIIALFAGVVVFKFVKNIK
jgi:hypothetical protein